MRRGRLLPALAAHLGDLPLRLAQRCGAAWDYAPLPPLSYPELDGEVYCHRYGATMKTFSILCKASVTMNSWLPRCGAGGCGVLATCGTWGPCPPHWGSCSYYRRPAFRYHPACILQQLRWLVVATRDVALLPLAFFP